MLNAALKLFLWVVIICSILQADELNDLKIELQELKEKVTSLNNRIPLIKDKGLGFSIGFPTGLYNNDHLYGIDVGYFFRNHLGVRIDVHFLGSTDRDYYLLVGLPTVGILGKSPLFYNFQTYGGVFIGASKELNRTKMGPYFHIRGFAGIEFITTKKVSFFIEVGGGGITSDVEIDYTRGTLICGGSRIYF